MPLFKKKLANADGIAGPATGVSASSTQRPESNSFLPKWILGLRALQFLVALLVLGLASYAEHVWHIHAAYVPAIVAAVLTILIFIPITLLHHLARGRMYNPRTHLLTDLTATLLWLAVMAVVASYSHILRPVRYLSSATFDTVQPTEFYRAGAETTFNEKRVATDYLIGDSSSQSYNNAYRKARRGWRAGAAAAAFSGLEFLLFLITTLLFLKYYSQHFLSRSGPSAYAADSAGTGPSTANNGFGFGGSRNSNAIHDFEMQHHKPANYGDVNPTTSPGIGTHGSGPLAAPESKLSTDGGNAGRSVV